MAKRLTDPRDDLYRQLQTELADAANETEVRDRFCGAVREHLRFQFRMERGRTDAYRNRVVLEFKDKGLFCNRTKSAKFREAYSKLVEQYIPYKAREDGLLPQDYIGVAIDGKHYAFVFVEETGATRHTSLLPVDVNGLAPLLSALELDTRRAFTFENLLTDFGPRSESARQVVSGLWSHLNNSLRDGGPQKVKMLFQEWRKLFAQATNFGRIGQTRLNDYFRSIGFTGRLDYARVLFTLHTYNALLCKLLAAELVTTIRYKAYSGFASEAAGAAPDDLRELLAARIEDAEIFRANNIENLIEGTFFSWYLEEAPSDLIEAIRKVLSKLGFYLFPTTAHPHVRDVIKDFYQNLVPEALRKNIGEFYTPEWLVNYVLNRTGYQGESVLNKRLLDPCCGSGNFLIHGIARCKAAAAQRGYTHEETTAHILANVIGFDLNPLAVIAARVNYLLAMADVLPTTGRIEIPVYLADAVYAPVQGEKERLPVRTYNIGTVIGSIALTLPDSLVQDRTKFSEVLSTMERDVKAGDARDTFISHLQQHQPIARALDRHANWEAMLGEMYDRIVFMEGEKWNGIWCRIVRNYFSSVAIGRVDVIAGNPPWVRWSELPADYCERIKPTCEQYSIFSRTPFYGGNELDISGMIAYIVTDKWLADGGTLGFVITQIHFQAPSSEGFRGFVLPSGDSLGISEVDDFTEVRPFRGTANKPAVFTWVRGQKTQYPVTYTVWRKRNSESIPENATLEQALAMLTATRKVAVPISPDNRWSILLPNEVGLRDKLAGGSDETWKGRKGITADLNGVYFVELLGPGVHPGLVKIRTQPESGKKPIPRLDADVDAELVYPLLKGGKQIRPFSFTPIELVAIVPNRVITSIPPEHEFRQQYNATHKYFQRINRSKDTDGTPLLESRSTWKGRMQAARAPKYAVYNVGEYTFAPYKVVWAEMGKVVSAVVTSQTLPHGIGRKVVIPDHKVYFVATNSKQAAHYLCAMVNSSQVNTFTNSFVVKLQIGTLFRHLRLPPFNAQSTFHVRLAELSEMAHSSGLTPKLQEEIDSVAWQVIDG